MKAMWRPADCSVLNQLTSLFLAQACPLHKPHYLVGPSVLNKVITIDSGAWASVSGAGRGEELQALNLRPSAGLVCPLEGTLVPARLLSPSAQDPAYE